jgi:hypothetical protein
MSTIKNNFEVFTFDDFNCTFDKVTSKVNRNCLFYSVLIGLDIGTFYRLQLRYICAEN